MTKQESRKRDLIFLKAMEEDIMALVTVTSIVAVTPLPDKRLINNPVIAKCGHMVNGSWDWYIPYLDKLTARELLRVCKLVHVVKE